MQISDQISFSGFHGHGCRWEEPSDLSQTRTKTLNEDVFLRPNGHFEDSDGQHTAGLPPGQQEEEAGETGETPSLLSPAGCLFIYHITHLAVIGAGGLNPSLLALERTLGSVVGSQEQWLAPSCLV